MLSMLRELLVDPFSHCFYRRIASVSNTNMATPFCFAALQNEVEGYRGVKASRVWSWALLVLAEILGLTSLIQ